MPKNGSTAKAFAEEKRMAAGAVGPPMYAASALAVGSSSTVLA
jgi:hypothetical protein